MTPRPKRLTRLNRLAEDRAELAMQGARREEAAAKEDVAEAQRVQAAVDAGKQVAGAATLDIARYAHALELDAIAEERLARAEQKLDARRDGAEAARALYESANRRTRATESRDARAHRSEADAQERRAFDEILDLWSAGPRSRR